MAFGGPEALPPRPAPPPDGEAAAALVRRLEAPRTCAGAADAPVARATPHWHTVLNPTALAALVEGLGLPPTRIEDLMASLELDQNRLRALASPEVRAAFTAAATPGTRQVRLGDRTVTVPTPFPSPADWRDPWIYFLVLDRFDNPAAPPRRPPWNGRTAEFQGGTFNGVRRRLAYLKDLGAGAVWLSPVQKNRASDPFTYHGYGIQHFLRIEPRFASAPGREEEELRALVDEAHALGLYVILDVVLNHCGDVFEYAGHGAAAPWGDTPRPIRWRDSDGRGRADWPAIEEVPAPVQDALVWPSELHRNAYFRRQGKGGEPGGDFESLKEFVTAAQDGGRFPVREVLIRAAQYLIARFDVDGFRIDTLKYVERDFAQTFGNAVREYALTVGKKNFFTFGEVYDDEEQIARFIGRNTRDAGDLVGVDAALDFPLFYRLPAVAKGLAAPAEVVEVYRRRKEVERDILSSHGDASRFFVTFLDNHDQHARFRFSPDGGPSPFDAQVVLGVALLMTLQGIPCLYYGTEQGLSGAGDGDGAVREALWGKAGAFDAGHPLYQAIRDLAKVRAAQPALRYGRQYFRPISGDGRAFGVSPFRPGVLAFSRILNDREVVVVANTHPSAPWAGQVIVDATLNPVGARFVVLNDPAASPPGPAVEVPTGATIREPDGSESRGPARALPVTLGPMAVQILAPALA
jgi:glycosidase